MHHVPSHTDNTSHHQLILNEEELSRNLDKIHILNLTCSFHVLLNNNKQTWLTGWDDSLLNKNNLLLTAFLGSFT